MYFEIENTPENLKKSRKKEVVQNVSVEECPKLILKPFSRPPQVVFDNVLIGTTCTKELEVENPLKHVQQIRLGKSLPPGLIIHLPGDHLDVEPETCYCLTMTWSPTQLTALRETIHFTNEKRGRYDVIIVLKSAVKGKGKLKKSPGKIQKKKGKKSPVATYKKKIETIYKTTTVTKKVNIVQSTQYKTVDSTNKENFNSDNYQYQKCPFDSMTSLDFDSSEVFSNMLHQKKGAILHETYDKSFTTMKENEKSHVMPKNILQPSNRQVSAAFASDIFDNLAFTPPRCLNSRNDKLDKGPKIIISVNSESDFDDTVDIKSSNKENETHPLICVTSLQQPNQWLTVNSPTQNVQYTETPTIIKKIPSTSSPKDVNSPNFSIMTDFSRISELSFFPQKFSTERKTYPKTNNETHDIVDDSPMNVKPSSDTYTKESPYTRQDYPVNQTYTDSRHIPPFVKELNHKMCRQSLFNEQLHKEINEKNCWTPQVQYPWHNNIIADTKSPPRSLSPPLQSIPEENSQYSDTQIFDKSNKYVSTLTINRTFDKPSDNSLFADRRTSWSKKTHRADTVLWKIPTKRPVKSKIINKTKETLNNVDPTMEKSINQSNYLNYIENVYSQSFTVDPFLSTTYFYEKESVENFEKEFKRWLNCILTPPADLDSNVEHKVDFGKAWIENRNKEVPLAPTKEQVCNTYHNSHRLESLRKSARALLRSPEISQVFIKLNAQIEKKLIAIRNDKNLHLDIGLQKIIMEIIHSYNPLWLRIGLEAIYDLTLPLKSNNDVEGLTIFIIQRMFKNPNLKNKNSKASAPNMLLPAYIEAIKKFTLNKFFNLVFFLDHAKQKKLIPHDPCLFRRNAICKESKEIVIQFTRELIAGIGDITRHLRPLGYVVSHKQSYLDEYIYAVHNLAVDIRDGVRLTKVMEIILMRKSLSHQLRTPPISRLQKIHNVQVALNALKEANFVIVGDITATDIAEGHREKTLSLLWQIIHVFRAPLFERAANVIQTWWRKKYKIISEQRKLQERFLAVQNTAATLIQNWWRCIQYNRMVDDQMRKVTTATVIIQKYCRMMLCRTRYKKFKTNALKISEWYLNCKAIQKAKERLQILRLRREETRNKFATIVQANVKRWLCQKKFKCFIKKIVLIQSIIRQYLERNRFISLKKSVIYIQQKYKGKLLMRKEMQTLEEKKTSAIRIQSYYKMSRQRKYYKGLKKSVQIVEKYYRALTLMRNDRTVYLKLKQVTIQIQASYRSKKCRKEYLRQRNLISNIQMKVRAHQSMKKDRANYLKIRNATIVIQSYMRAYQARKKYITQRNSAIVIQGYFRSYLQMKAERNSYVLLRKSVIEVQTRYRSLIAMRKARKAYLKLKNSVLVTQRRYRALISMRDCKNKYQKFKKAVLIIQRRYKLLLEMRKDRQKYMKLKISCITIQNAYRAYLKGKQQRQIYQKQKESAIKIQNWYRSLKMGKVVMQNYVRTRNACTTIQQMFKAYVTGKKQRLEFIKIKTATVCIQKYYRNYLLTKTIRREYLEIKKSTVTIQRFYQLWMETKRQRQSYIRIRQATVVIQTHFRQYQITKRTRQEYCTLKLATVFIQQRYRAYKLGVNQRTKYLQLKYATINLQQRFRAIILMRKERQSYLKIRSATLLIQRKFRARQMMLQEKSHFRKVVDSSIAIQRFYRAYLTGTKQRQSYIKIRSAVILIQTRYREYRETKITRLHYVQLRTVTIFIQRKIRAKNNAREIAKKMAVDKIQTWYTSIKQRNQCRSEFIDIRIKIISIQAIFRGYICRKRYLLMRSAAVTIQNFYRSYKLTKVEREKYIRFRSSITKLQAYVRRFIERKCYIKLRATALTLQAVYRFKKTKALVQKRRQEAVMCIQKNIRRYLAVSRYKRFREKVIFIQRLWRRTLITKLIRCEFLQKKRFISKLQAAIRGYLARKNFEQKKEALKELREEQKKNWAASKIQALFRGHKVRVASSARVGEMRRRWRNGALASTQETLHECNIDALDAICNIYDLSRMIKALKSFELLTEVYPMLYDSNASMVVNKLYLYMSVMNRSLSCVLVLKLAGAILVNLTRYKRTGPKIYVRDHINPTLLYMLRFSNSEPQLFCILCTYIWLFSKYDKVKKDLTELLNTPDNHKIMLNIKRNVNRMKRMEQNTRNNVFRTPQPSKFIPRTINQSLRVHENSVCSHMSDDHYTMPALEPDYGIARIDKPRYFTDAQQAIDCLFETYNL